MRKIKIKFGSYFNVYIRTASDSGDLVEIQGQYGGIIVKKPSVRRSVLYGVVINDRDPRLSGITTFTDFSSGFEANSYTREHYRG